MTLDLGRIRLAVIGGGPTGLAALFHAARLGLPALALEAGENPLAAVQDHLEGLIFVSPSTHYEVAGLPLDCRDTGEVTREEVLHYYARLVEYGRLDVRARWRCVDLEPGAHGVTLHVETPLGPGRLVAEDVIVATWYEPQPVPPEYGGGRAGLRVVRGLRNPAEVAGRRTVIIGGGLSAFEHAIAIMLIGRPVTLVARTRLPPFYAGDAFTALVEATGSTLLTEASDIAVGDEGVRCVVAGAPRLLPCDVVVACLGARLSPGVRQLLAQAGVLTAAELDALASAPRHEQLVRRGLPAQGLVARRPDLWRHLFEGVGRIRLAGGALHAGGPDAGVITSIFTATLAVDAVAGRAPPAELALAPPLPAALSTWVGRAMKQLALPAYELVAPLRPVAVRSWSRSVPRLLGEDPAGQIQAHPDEGPGKYLWGPLRDNSFALEIMRVADGRTSVAELCADAGADSDEARAEVVQALCNLWRRNALSWLPPPGGLRSS